MNIVLFKNIDRDQSSSMIEHFPNVSVLYEKWTIGHERCRMIELHIKNTLSWISASTSFSVLCPLTLRGEEFYMY